MNKKAIGVIILMLVITLSSVLITAGNGKVMNEINGISINKNLNTNITYVNYSNEYLLAHSIKIGNASNMANHLNKYNGLVKQTLIHYKILNSQPKATCLTAPNFLINCNLPTNLFNYLNNLPGGGGALIYNISATYVESGSVYSFNNYNPMYAGWTSFGYGNGNVQDFISKQIPLDKYSQFVTAKQYLNNISTLPNYIQFSLKNWVYYANNYEFQNATNVNYWYSVIYKENVFYSNSISSNSLYQFTFQDLKNTFNLSINGQTYSNTNSITIDLSNGSYYYTVTFNNTTYYNNLIVNGKGQIINVANSKLVQFTMIYFYVYITIAMLSIIAILRMSGGFLNIFGMTSVMYVYIGYNLQLPYFNITLITTIVTLLTSIIVYKLVLEE